jgi:hypothetical protein
MFAGSHIYKPSMTIGEVAGHYTSTDQVIWAKNVAAHLGVSPATRLGKIGEVKAFSVKTDKWLGGGAMNSVGNPRLLFNCNQNRPSCKPAARPFVNVPLG